MKKCNFVLGESELGMLDALKRTRKDRSPRANKRWSKGSFVVRDTIKMLYEYEILKKSKVHPDEHRQCVSAGRC